MLLLRGMNRLGWAWMVLLEGLFRSPIEGSSKGRTRCARPAPAWPSPMPGSTSTTTPCASPPAFLPFADQDNSEISGNSAICSVKLGFLFFFSPSPLVGGDFFFSFWRKDAIRGPCMHAVGCSSHGRDRGLWGTDTAIDSQDGCVSHSLMCRVSRFAVVLAGSGSGGRGGNVVLVLASNYCQPTSRVGGISAVRPGYRPTGRLTWLSRFISADCPNISEL